MHAMREHPLLFITLLSAVTLAFVGLLTTIFYPLFWAMVLAIVCTPLYLRIRAYVRSETFAALSTLLVAFLCILVPTSILGTLLAQEARTAYNALNETGTVQGYALIHTSDIWLAHVESYGIPTDSLRTTITESAKNISAAVATHAVSIGRATASTFLSVCIMLYVLFYLLRDGSRIGAALKQAFPLDDNDEQFLFNRFAEMTRAMFKGTIIVALAQGIIGSALFFVAGISSPLLWGLVMALLAIIPGVGPALVWVPAGILLLITGALWPALVVLGGGAVLVSYADNVLRPMLIGRDTGMPDVLVFVSVIAGLSVFGITGLVIGPTLAALTLAFWELYARA